MRLEGRTLVVTGASGIAAAGVRRFATEGARVFMISIDGDQCQAVADDLAWADVGWATADLTNEEETVAAFARCREQMGVIDGLFAVAGGSGRAMGDGPIDQIPLAGWKATIDMNLVPPFQASREAIRLMDEGGSIVLVGSVLAQHPSELFVTHAYAAAKGALLALTRSMAAHYASQGIRVNLIAPGLVATPMSQRAAADPESVAYAVSKQPLAGGFLEPDDVADAALFLLGAESARITGQVIEVDGGWGVTEAPP